MPLLLFALVPVHRKISAIQNIQNNADLEFFVRNKNALVLGFSSNAGRYCIWLADLEQKKTMGYHRKHTVQV